MKKFLKEQEKKMGIPELRTKDLSRVKIMWINYPHMPTGAVAATGLFEELIGIASKPSPYFNRRVCG